MVPCNHHGGEDATKPETPRATTPRIAKQGMFLDDGGCPLAAPRSSGCSTPHPKQRFDKMLALLHKASGRCHPCGRATTPGTARS